MHLNLKIFIYAISITTAFYITYTIYNRFIPQKISSTTISTPQTQKITNQEDSAIMYQNLTIPWEIVFLPNGDYLITERPGKLLLINKKRTQTQTIQGVEQIGEGGLLGIALHPKFEENHKIYLFLTYSNNGVLTNKVEQYSLNDNTLRDKKVIIDGIKGSSIHDGGRIAFGPDNMLYITTGDAGQSNLSQNTDSLNGKILRVTDTGKIPSDNPFDNAVYSYGHRNVQGLAWDDRGTLWATEHGPSGLETGYDELNNIIKGGNYGWPDVKGDQKKSGTIPPIIQSGRNETWAPTGIIFYKNTIFFAGLRGESIYKVTFDEKNNVTFTKHFTKVFGRIRTLTLGPDNYFYILTNNTDGRGTLKENDDKLIRINPEVLLK